MPKRNLDRLAASTSLLQILRREGACPAGTLPARLDIAHATLSRIIKSLGLDIVTLGRGRATKYAARRSIKDLPDQLPVFEILPDGSSRTLGQLIPVAPTSLAFIPSGTAESPVIYRDLPYFLDDARPSGFLGRLIPLRHPELHLPEDVRIWSTDTCLRYLHQFGWNSSGSLIVGEGAFSLYLRHSQEPSDLVETKSRVKTYPRLATNLLSSATAGSSLSGEQPKFLVTRATDLVPLIVKFSPPTNTDVGLRYADLLICEHLALETIAAHGHTASKSTLINAGNRVFLEVERFDRTKQGGRIGLLSLHCLHAEFIGDKTDWTSAVIALAEQKIVPKEACREAHWLETFSKLIGNHDRHFGNLSFLADGLKPTKLAPAYDVLPMVYAPRGHQVFDADFVPPTPTPGDAFVWQSTTAAALDFWSRVSADQRISRPFRAIASANRTKLERSAELAAKLPTSS